ncbi:MAG: hypothetical protein KIT22_14145 [Verrucomicrobiae bacterium]|nr:hypothetical protein [Verrucomicrobiae bacterium]
MQSGGEHRVYFQQKTRRYIKETLLDRHLGHGLALGSFCRGATPSEYLDRLDLQNRIFGDDIQLARIVDQGGQPVVVTSQPSIEGVPANPDAIDALMASKSYEKLADGAFYDGKGLLIFDLFPRNVIQVGSGEVYPIDPVIQRITEDFADFLRGHPDTINRDF